jgi:xylulokinase
MPEVLKRAAQITDVKGFLLRWLTGKTVTDPSTSPNRLEWWPPVFEFIGWPIDKLPEIREATFSPGGLLADVAHELRFVEGTPVFTGTNDAAAAMLACGGISLGDSMTTLATNCGSCVVLPDRLEPKTMLSRFLFSWPFVEGYWLGGGTTGSGAGSLQWMANLLRRPGDKLAYDALLEEAESVPPGSNGVIFLPYLAGRGTPEANPRVSGGLMRLGLDHKRGDLVRAILEGISYALWEVYDEVSRLGIDVGLVRLTGGGARSKLWRRIIAAVLDRPVSYSSGDSTLGDAMVAAVGLGHYKDLTAATHSMTSPGEVDKPSPSEVDAYNHFRSIFQESRDYILKYPTLSYKYAGTSEMEASNLGHT